jgi:hypothetical protein
MVLTVQIDMDQFSLHQNNVQDAIAPPLYLTIGQCNFASQLSTFVSHDQAL